MNTKLVFLFSALLFGNLASGFSVRGKVLDSAGGEELIAVSIFLEEKGTGLMSDVSGNFEIALEGKNTLRFSYLGFESRLVSLDVKQDTQITVFLWESTFSSEEIVISARKTGENLSAPSVHSLSPEQWKLKPGFAGESDLMQAFFSMPGIKKAGDANGGMMVRGGSTDQNMLLLDGIPVYQSGHIISFYSPFQTETIKSATLYKGAIPAQYGGRLSSVLVLQSNEGSTDTAHFEAGLGLLAAKGYVNTPLLKNKMSLQLAGRRSLPDLLWPLAKQSFPARFYDGQMKLTYQLNPAGRFTLKMFHSADGLKTNGAEVAKYKETEKGLLPSMHLQSGIKESHIGLRYDHSGKVKTRLVLYYSQLESGNSLSWPENSLSIRSGMEDLGLSGDGTWTYRKKHVLRAGFNLVHHNFAIMDVSSEGELSQLIPSKGAEQREMTEGGVYLSDDLVFNARWRMEAGLRLSTLLSGKTPLVFPEPRLALYYQPNSWLHLNAGINRGTQFLQRLSSASAALPTDTWYPVLPGMKPQSVWMYQLGAKAEKGKWQLQAEAYYKEMKGLSEYQEGALPFVQDNLSKEVVRGGGQAYGADFQITYADKHIQVQAAYSLSWSTRQFDALNSGKVFYDRFDRRHDFNINVSSRISQHWQFSAAFYVASGARYTPKVAQFVMPGIPEPSPALLPVFGDRNSYRLSTTHRLDIGMTYSRTIRKAELQVQFGAYNVYNQLQSFRLETVERDGKLLLREVGLFGMVPSLGFNLKF